MLPALVELLCQTLHLQGFRGAPPLDKKAKLVTLGQTSSYIPSQWLAHGWECDLVHPETSMGTIQKDCSAGPPDEGVKLRQL